MNQDQINHAYKEALRLKNTNLSEFEIKDQLMTMGFSEKISEEAAQGISLERKVDKRKQAKSNLLLGAVLFTIGLVFCLVSVFALDGAFLIPIGFLSVGILYLGVGFYRMTKSKSDG
ncbi:MAG: hypothetical protein MRZ79_27575 [Bacteroidia bacterium]|nr:hypothetical protein [Bacteroidia bacterium]